MSALILNKPLRRERHMNDAYYTPPEFVTAGLALVDGTPKTILDPGAGLGSWGEGARQRWPLADITGVEIEPREPPHPYSYWYPMDYLGRRWGSVDLIIGNPPYVQAEAFIRHSLAQLTYGGVCVFLLRLAYLESQRRGQGLFQEHPPVEVSVCTRRPRFYGIKGNGGTAFAFVKWRRDYRGETRLTWSVT